MMNIMEDEIKLREIHKDLKIEFGSFEEEFPEQIMSVKFLTGNEKILEIGGNIGRNSLIIGYILNKNNNNNFVTLETNPYDADKLRYNRDLNNLNFHIENSALSLRKLAQHNWITIPCEEVPHGYFPVNTISWKDLNNKYNILFDTLILDCEGAIYYILQDMPEVLDNIKTIIIENDYWNQEKWDYVENIFKKKNYELVYSKDLTTSGYIKNFYEVWKKKE